MVAAHQGIAEGKLLRTLLRDLGIECKIHLCVDSKSAIAFGRKRGPGKRKHLERKALQLQEDVRTGVVELHYSPSEGLVADMLTKPLTTPRFSMLTEKIGMRAQKQQVEMSNIEFDDDELIEID